MSIVKQLAERGTGKPFRLYEGKLNMVGQHSIDVESGKSVKGRDPGQQARVAYRVRPKHFETMNET